MPPIPYGALANIGMARSYFNAANDNVAYIKSLATGLPRRSLMKASTETRLRNLGRAIARNAPAVEYTTLAVTSSLPSGAVENQIPVTTNFLANADFQSKVLGDKFRNLRLYHRHQFVGNVDIARIIIYVPKITGSTITGIGYSSIIDSAKFRVLYDTMVYPNSANQSRKSVVIANTPLNFLTNVDRTDETTAVTQTGEIRMLVVTTCSAASSMLSQYRLAFQNK